MMFLAVGSWVFLLLALGSFHATDWPSHAIDPHPPTGNLCGPAGAFVAYYLYLFIGQGVFPILFFTGVCIVLQMFRNAVGDLWMRAIGLLLLSIAFASAIHHFKPGAYDGFPEGQGGIIGIAAAHFLQHYFSTAGTRLILATTMLVGLLLAADDLVLRTPAMVGTAIEQVRQHRPQIKWNFPVLPRLPSLPRFVTKDSAAKGKRVTRGAAVEAEDDEPLKPPVMLRRETPKPRGAADQDLIDLSAAEEAEPNEDAAAATALLAPPKAEIIVKLPNTLKPRQTSPPPPVPQELGEYELPDWKLLADAEYGYAETQEQFVREKAAVLEQALKEFAIEAHVVEIDTGPVITMYELALAPGVKVSSITALSNDIARALMAVAVRIVAPVPGKNTVGIEVPNAQKEKVRLKELMQLAPEATTKQAIPLYLGKDASGEPLVTDLAAMPHCLIAGTTGSGKSVCINTIIMSIMYKQRPDVVKLILIDPKVVEMAAFKDIPHLMCPVINDTGRATSVLEWACEKMDERYEILAEAGVRNLAGYNKLTREELVERFHPETPEEEAKIPKHLPYIVIIIDELADLMMTSGKEVESFIVRLAQKARAVGIHLIVATQRPQATVVTGLIKSNMPSKIAFRVNTKMDSRIVLDQNGGELLLGQGDMLFLPPGASKPIRSQGTYIDDREIKESVKLVRSLAEAQYEPELVQIKSLGGNGADMEKDELFEDAVRIVLETKRGSVSLLQRRLTIGYSRASRLIEQMAGAGILGEYKGSQARECNITIDQWEQMKAAQQTDQASGMSV
jgi:S-DNA-T family DNA segregation ATPase FtsK/SpoIIIE